MNEKLLKRLGLPADATPEAIEARVAELIDRSGLLTEQVQKLTAQLANSGKVETDTAKLEKRILAKIAESGGALNRDQALIAIQHQAEHTPKTKAKK